jgi:hypothetical protein
MTARRWKPVQRSRQRGRLRCLPGKQWALRRQHNQPLRTPLTDSNRTRSFRAFPMKFARLLSAIE